MTPEPFDRVVDRPPPGPPPCPQRCWERVGKAEVWLRGVATRCQWDGWKWTECAVTEGDK